MRRHNTNVEDIQNIEDAKIYIKNKTWWTCCTSSKKLLLCAHVHEGDLFSSSNWASFSHVLPSTDLDLTWMNRSFLSYLLITCLFTCRQLKKLYHKIVFILFYFYFQVAHCVVIICNLFPFRHLLKTIIYFK